MLSLNVVLSLTCIKGHLSVAQYSYFRLINSDTEDNCNGYSVSPYGAVRLQLPLLESCYMV